MYDSGYLGAAQAVWRACLSRPVASLVKTGGANERANRLIRRFYDLWGRQEGIAGLFDGLAPDMA